MRQFEPTNTSLRMPVVRFEAGEPAGDLGVIIAVFVAELRAQRGLFEEDDPGMQQPGAYKRVQQKRDAA
jgi:hypothetical protein